MDVKKIQPYIKRLVDELPSVNAYDIAADGATVSFKHLGRPFRIEQVWRFGPFSPKRVPHLQLFENDKLYQTFIHPDLVIHAFTPKQR